MRPALALFTILAAALPAAAEVASPAGRVIECYCTDTGGARVEMGESICLRVDGRMFMAKCEMSLNVPMWRDTGQGCLSSALTPPAPSPSEKLRRLQPAADPGLVDPKV